MDKTGLRPASLAGARLERYVHACAFVRSREEEYQVLAPFVQEGLSWNERAMYIVDPARRDTHADRLCHHGLRAEALQHRLEVLTWDEMYLRDGHFDKNKMLDTVRSTMASSAEQGFSRLRVVGQMGWAFRDHPGVDQLLEYEVQVNDVLAKTRTPAVCVYDLDALTGTMVMDLLRAHPMSIVGGALYENPFYVSAEKLLNDPQRRHVPG